jgi:hypothetical protein
MDPDEEAEMLSQMLPDLPSRQVSGFGGNDTFGLAPDDFAHLVDTLGGHEWQDPQRDGQLIPEAMDWSKLELYTTHHSVHLVSGEGAEREYVVSNIRDFKVDLSLQDRRTGAPSAQRLELKASVLYENSNPVRASPGEATLLGAKGTSTEACVVGGRATFNLRMGAGILSKKHDNQRFRIKIEPVRGKMWPRPRPPVLLEAQLCRPLAVHHPYPPAHTHTHL